MWIFCKNGFVSIVKHIHLPGKLLVRARVREDLDKFVEILDELGRQKHEIEETPDADYRFRTAADQQLVAEALSKTTLDIDYPNFKDAAHGDPDRDKAFMAVWRAMYQLQKVKDQGESKGKPNIPYA